MQSTTSAGTWIWHPDWIECGDKTSAGAFVHFRKSVDIAAHTLPTQPVRVQISADTKYKLYINAQLVSIGPVKGDEHLWFYDEVDIQPFLKPGINIFSVRVLRFYYATLHATSFPRLPFAGLLIRNVDEGHSGFDVQSHDGWETALDLSTRLPTNLQEDDFLHVYENVDKSQNVHLDWVAAKHLEFPSSHGITAPWKLSPRMIPRAQNKLVHFTGVQNVRSTESVADWKRVMFNSVDPDHPTGIRLPPGTSHHLELEVEHHMTAFLNFRFQKKPNYTGKSSLRVTYSECYEDTPKYIPYFRCKGDRRDTTKNLIGPEDNFSFGGGQTVQDLHYHKRREEEEVFAPFHFRTFRFITLDINVAEESDLIFYGIDLTTTNYPMKVVATFETPDSQNLTTKLWETSIRTLINCMHDCYEDCPFYEQLQYAMDIRSSSLFTYCLSVDDRLARQAMIQLHNSYKSSTGLTASRAPAAQFQSIPHFSLYWICMITDHFDYFGDVEFIRQFIPACDGVLEHFSRRIDSELGLVRGLGPSSPHWDFVDWAESWRPMGIPPAAQRTGFLSYTNMLYAYTLKKIAKIMPALGRPAHGLEYQVRAEAIVTSVQQHCYDGHFFTDGLASLCDPDQDMSQHSQVWAVLCGAATGNIAGTVLKGCLASKRFTPTSISASFYTLRALSVAGGDLYDDHFHAYWEPWRVQLSQGLTTWEEDTVSHRSDCHAWGSAPIYEFVAEVAGIRPESPGWATMTFQPRISLFPELNTRIPFGSGAREGIAHVSWKREGHHVEVTLLLTMNSGEIPSVPVLVIFPDGKRETLNGSSKITLQMKL